MNRKYIIVTMIALILGISLGFIDSLLHHFIFKDGGDHFLDTAIYGVGAEEIFERGIYLVICLIIGYITVYFYRRIDEDRAKYSAIFNGSVTGLIVFDTEGQIVDVNPRTCQMYGYNHDQMVGMSVVDIADPGVYNARFLDFLATNQGETFHTETPDKRSDGSTMIVEVVGTSFSYHNKKLYLAMLTDVTTKKETEGKLRMKDEALTEKRRELDLLFGISHLILMSKGALSDTIQGIINMISASWHYPGKSHVKASVRGRDYQTHGFIESRQRLKSKIKMGERIVGNLEVHFEDLDPDHPSDFLAVEDEMLVNTIAEGIASVIERYDVEEDYRIRNRFLGSIIDSIPYPFYVIDLVNGTIGLMNKAGENNHPESTICYKCIHGRQYPCNVASEEEPRFVCLKQEIAKTGSPCMLERTIKGPDGKDRYIEIYGFPIYNDRGEFTHLIEYCVDVTVQASSSQKIREAYAKLETTISGIPDLVFEVSFDGRLMDYRSQHPDLITVKSPSLVGKLPEEVLPKDVANAINSCVGRAKISGCCCSSFVLQTHLGEMNFEMSVVKKKPHGNFIIVVRNTSLEGTTHSTTSTSCEPDSCE
jgi:PAS domain S-box-containing protein